MSKHNNPYIAKFDGLKKEDFGLVRTELFSNISGLELDGSYVIDEIKDDLDMSIEELMDILELEAFENKELKMFIFAVRLNLKKSRVVKDEPPINDENLDDDHQDDFEDLEYGE